MRKLIIAAAFAASAVALPASAAPLAPSNPAADAASPVIQAQGYHYRRDCYWTGTGWGYRDHGRVLVCRPYRPPGAGWYWYSEGPRHGWYHKKHGWHHKW
jgi:hypothetical protein